MNLDNSEAKKKEGKEDEEERHYLNLSKRWGSRFGIHSASRIKSGRVVEQREREVKSGSVAAYRRKEREERNHSPISSFLLSGLSLAG